jgi:uncharacterized protein YgiM (DUF1202 family)
MNKRIEGYLLYAIILFFLGNIFLLYPVFPSILQGQILKDKVNIREDSRINSPILGQLNKNDLVEILKEKFDWYKIRLPKNFRCYVFAKYIRRIDQDKAEVTASSLNIRMGPSTDSTLVGKAKKGDVLAIFSHRNESEWTQINCYPYAEGWIHKSLVRIVKLEKMKEKKTAEKREKRKEVPPLIKGRLKNMNQNINACAANYILENDTGIVFLKINTEIDVEGLINKEVNVWGKIENDTCIYIKAENILPVR